MALLDIFSAEPITSVRLSIRNHLLQLLNSRQGSLPHLPDYGLPDVAAIYQGLPYSIPTLLMSVKQVIEKYEPRLRSVTVKHQIVDTRDSVLHLQISGLLNQGEPVQFETYFVSGGGAELDVCNTSL